jgi:hypothetical protein
LEGRRIPIIITACNIILATAILALALGGCGRPAAPGTITAAGLGAADKSYDGNGVLYVGLMVHLEGWRSEAEVEEQFRDHAELVRLYASLFEAYGAKLTLEASPEFVQACINWGDNVLKEMYDRGHGVGVHADLGSEPGLTQERFDTLLREQVAAAESLGIPVRHASGICSYLDWISAAESAGLEFITGVVEFGLKSIPPDRLPPAYSEVVVSSDRPADLHGLVPYGLLDRVRPWTVNSGADWLWEDPGGREVIMDTGAEGLTRIAEDVGPGRGRGGNRELFDQADVDEFVRQMELAMSYTSPDNVTTFYAGWSLGQALDPATLENLLRAVKKYVDSGEVQWKSIPNMYDEYLKSQ